MYPCLVLPTTFRATHSWSSLFVQALSRYANIIGSLCIVCSPDNPHATASSEALLICSQLSLQESIAENIACKLHKTSRKTSNPASILLGCSTSPSCFIIITSVRTCQAKDLARMRFRFGIARKNRRSGTRATLVAHRRYDAAKSDQNVTDAQSKDLTVSTACLVELESALA